MTSDNSEKIVEDIITLINRLNLSGISDLVSRIKEKYNISSLEYSSSLNGSDDKSQEKSSSSHSFFSLVISSLPTSNYPRCLSVLTELWNSVNSTTRSPIEFNKEVKNVVSSENGGILISKIPKDKVEEFKKKLDGFTSNGLKFSFEGDNS